MHNWIFRFSPPLTMHRIEKLNKEYMEKFIIYICKGNGETESFPFTMKLFNIVVYVFSFPVGYEGNQIGYLTKKMRRFDHLGKDLKLSGVLEIFLREPNIQECIWKCDVNEQKNKGCDGVNYNPDFGDCELVASGSSGLILDRGWLAYSSLHHRKFPKVAEWVTAGRGKFPVGAMEGGKTSSGEILYIGRTRHESNVLPCKLHPSKSACYVPYGGKEIAKDTYKVLVNITKGNLDWVAASGGSVPKGALLGGRTAGGEPLFICRCMHEEDFICGKSSICTSPAVPFLGTTRRRGEIPPRGAEYDADENAEKDSGDAEGTRIYLETRHLPDAFHARTIHHVFPMTDVVLHINLSLNACSEVELQEANERNTGIAFDEENTFVEITILQQEQLKRKDKRRFYKETESVPFTMKFSDVVVFVLSFRIGNGENEMEGWMKKMRRFDLLEKDFKLSGVLEIFLQQPNIQECIWKCDINEHKGGGCDGVNYNPEMGDCELDASGPSGLIRDSGWMAYSSLNHRKFPKVAEWVTASNGKFPVGAMEGGKTGDGEKLYVGRTKHESEILPCKLHPSHGFCFAPYGGKEFKKDTYEVLVNITKSNLDWVAASGGSVPVGALLGGRTAGGEPLFICRCMHEKDFICGKASRDLQFYPGSVTSETLRETTTSDLPHRKRHRHLSDTSSSSSDSGPELFVEWTKKPND
ncbi:unnamed protein product [Darwinula stevensoni]|uniref:Uncharacterized protein n=1 Tax=Darwinula stevensoni TaxID=69355 RepID=A0A7R8XEP0_9CRUS|nr:unnamed protein product [Darwinula stevensoni]CAG0889772.1 unnamed protein product [Darwinula stevensoni]